LPEAVVASRRRPLPDWARGDAERLRTGMQSFGYYIGTAAITIAGY
jgi:hypothetical protein